MPFNNITGCEVPLQLYHFMSCSIVLGEGFEHPFPVLTVQSQQAFESLHHLKWQTHVLTVPFLFFQKIQNQDKFHTWD